MACRISRSRRAFLAISTGFVCSGAAVCASKGAEDQTAGPERVPAHRRPMFIDRAGLRVRNLEGMILFYQQVIGLQLISRSKRTALLGIGGAGLLELVQDLGATPAPPKAAGLYHLAFEMPTRQELARWIVHVARHHFQVSGLADHKVTESVYLNDPEGNGVEVYADRPENQWVWSGDQVAMGVFDLEVDPLLQLADRDERFSIAPPAMRIGHIHLKVGDLAAAEAFYSGLIGFDVTRRAPGVVFMSSGKYHHHLAANVWESQGAGRHSDKVLGLFWFSIIAADRSIVEDRAARLRNAGVAFSETPGGLSVQDPWRHEVRLRPA